MPTSDNLSLTVDQAREQGFESLRVHCSCDRVTYLSWKLLKLPADLVLSTIVQKLSCKACRQPPRTVQLFRNAPIEDELAKNRALSGE